MSEYPVRPVVETLERDVAVAQQEGLRNRSWTV